ncbi:site-specific integrase [Rhodobacteraceae bacterium HSP-20]|uniref:Site-specific integrase n=1 Tax=Paragemmobacter amnigenus TaxID=2852097 RepID=A0ABS6J5T3_9RHOB|nr:site-specific integrase [Rhodobacter amnigenus]MBU9697812.1 site-specific integrase [Rhodobacter amnigenus]MBV4389039.1 site-specific integrase [Rhodobacter amnigenus]
MGDIPLEALTTEILDGWVIGQRRGGYKPGTINKHINYLNRILNLARVWEIENGPKRNCKVSKRMPMGDHRQKFLGEAEIHLVLESCRREQHPYLDLFVHLLILTGARSSEARLARWCDFDMQRMVWTVPLSKSGRARRIVLSSSAAKVLEQIRQRTEGLGLPVTTDSHLFINPRLRQPYKSFHLAWDRARRRLGMQDVRIHDLRHTYASLLINRGASIYEVQKLLGHHHISMTERYAHLLPDTLHQRVEIVARLLDDTENRT